MDRHFGVEAAAFPFQSSTLLFFGIEKARDAFPFALFDNANIAFKLLSFDIVESQPNENAQWLEG